MTYSQLDEKLCQDWIFGERRKLCRINRAFTLRIVRIGDVAEGLTLSFRKHFFCGVFDDV